MTKPKLSNVGRTVTVRVPISVRRRGGRKLVLAPDGAEITAPVIRHVDNALVKAIARAFRWREILEGGACATIAEIAIAENINESYVGRVLRLSLLAPDIIEAILMGRQSAEVQLEQLLRRFPMEWPLQWRAFRGPFVRSDDDGAVWLPISDARPSADHSAGRATNLRLTC